jgi:hypothetical protein
VFGFKGFLKKHFKSKKRKNLDGGHDVLVGTSRFFRVYLGSIDLLCADNITLVLVAGRGLVAGWSWYVASLLVAGCCW